jgi:2-polyprenyl-3-methyl-5-hydroxy-6-metoxy-1,4-benzoquinol methylase
VTKLANVELERLANDFGWSGWEKNEDGVLIVGKPFGDQVSFPSDSWEDQSFNEGGMGIWAEIRLNEVRREAKALCVRTLWDVGAGNGAISLGLAKEGINVIAVEPQYPGAKFIANSGVTAFNATLSTLRLPDSCLPAIGVFDVIEHIEDPLGLLTDFRDKLMDDGLLLVTVPSHAWLFSSHDTSIGHFRRYTAKSLRSQLQIAGFEVVSLRHIFSFLVPAAFLLRVLPEKFGRKPDFQKRIISAKKQLKAADSLSWVFRVLWKFERLLNLPFGLSILCIARVRKIITP